MRPSMWNRRDILGGVVAVATLGVGLLPGCGDSVKVGPREGRRAPNFSVQTLDGQRIERSSTTGTPTLLVFWASWCGPCRREAEEIRGIVDSYGSRVQVVSVNSGEDPTKVRLTAREWGLTWPVGLDPRGSVSRTFEVDALPLVLVLDADGLVRFRGNGLPSDPHRLLDGLAG